MGIQSREVKQRHAVYHEAGQMLGRQTVAQPHRQIERLLVVHGFEGSTHAQQYTISDAGAASLRQTASIVTVVVALLGLMISFLQWHHPRPSDASESSSGSVAKCCGHVIE